MSGNKANGSGLVPGIESWQSLLPNRDEIAVDGRVYVVPIWLLGWDESSAVDGASMTGFWCSSRSFAALSPE